MPSSPAIFLDRDGTLTRDVCHAADPAALTLLPGAIEALAAFRAAGYRLVVVTNQSGVARGLFSVAEARATGLRLAALLQPAGIRLSGFYLCPHHPDGAVTDLAVRCACRKPAPGLLLRAAADLDLDLSRSWTIGDMPSDVLAGEAAGTRTVLVDNGHLALGPDAWLPPLVARNIAHAALLVLAADGHIARPVAPCPPDDLRRPPGPPEPKTTGTPSPYPDPPRLAAAERDAEALRGISGRAETCRSV
jgi:D-glycero-D-manno-heptose 1,7-bisphosphate phosphatase